MKKEYDMKPIVEIMYKAITGLNKTSQHKEEGMFDSDRCQFCGEFYNKVKPFICKSCWDKIKPLLSLEIESCAMVLEEFRSENDDEMDFYISKFAHAIRGK